MPWVRITDMLDVDPDLVLFTPEAVCWYVCATTWAARNLTDGLVPFAIAPTIKGYSRDTINDLLTKAMPRKEPWVVETEDGYLIRSFLKFNPSAEEVIKLREERSEAGRRGGFKKAENQANASKPLASARHELDLLPSKTLAKLCPVPVPVPVPSPIPVPSGKKALTLGDQKLSSFSEKRLAFVDDVMTHFREVTGRQLGKDPKSAVCAELRGRYDEFHATLPNLADICKRIIDYKAMQWLNDPEMNHNVNPRTLFRRGHWENYLAQTQEWEAKGRPNAKGERTPMQTFNLIMGGVQ